MVKIILGIIVGFVAWSIVWVGSDQFLHALSRGWYGGHQDRVALAVVNNESFNADTMIVVIGLVRSFIATIISGFLAALVAGENRKAPLILGIILLIVGIAVQVHLWKVFPIWYHFIFLFSLIPLSILGGRMKRIAQ